MSSMMCGMLLGAGVSSKKTYVDDVFSTYVYKGSTSAQTFNNGIDLANEGGMVWSKYRTSNSPGIMFDTERGKTKFVRTASNDAEDTSSTAIASFNSNGFSVGANDGWTNWSNNTFASWTFRKAPGFFDVVKFSAANSSNQRVSHSLGCVPGFILFKKLNASQSWIVYHRDLGPDAYIRLDLINGKLDSQTGYFGPDGPTATDFGIKSSAYWDPGPPADEIIAYVFAGGASTAATARSVDLDGSGDRLTLAASTDFEFGTGDFTVECWAKPVYITSQGVWQISQTSGGLNTDPRLAVAFGSDGKFRCVGPAGDQWVCGEYAKGQWYHIARVRASGVSKLYINGTEVKSYADTTNYTYQNLCIGGYYSTSYLLEGEISNFRVVKGTAVYTSSFRPPTEPLTNITNTKLLCCNNASVTGSTVTPGTITAHSNPTALTDSPFDDPAGFIFGENGDQGIIKCGSYVGDGSATHKKIELGFEPQWVMVKRSDAASSWTIADMMRGTPADDGDSNQNGPFLWADSTSAEATDRPITTHSTGFGIKNTSSSINGDGGTYIYIALRRPDGYCGKPVEDATKVFAMDTGNNSSDIPAMDSGFPVDFALKREPASSNSWRTTARLMGAKGLFTDTTGAEYSASSFVWDSNVGWLVGAGSSEQSWMWKKSAGFDCIAFTGSTTDPGPSHAHGLGKIPELKIIKRRNASSTGWITTGTVISQALAGNNNSKDYYVYLNTDAAATNHSNYWSGGNDSATHFTVRHGNGEAGGSADPYLCLLFASVDGISKVGFYTGDGTNNGSHEINCGFTPRFILIKCVTSGVSFSHWRVWDSLNGLDGSGNEDYLKLNSNGAKVEAYDYIDTTSTGFKFNTNFGPVNGSGNKMIYYAHA